MKVKEFVRENSYYEISNWIKHNIKSGEIKKVITLSTSSATVGHTVFHYGILIYE